MLVTMTAIAALATAGTIWTLVDWRRDGHRRRPTR
jgi:hypothetical protein